MKELNLPVPSFFVLPTEFYDLYKKGPPGVLPQIVKDFLDQNLGPQPNETWAVRSSSTKEDGQTDSFAGLFETFLNLNTREEIEESILKCWDSTSSERVLHYAKKRGIESSEIKMALVIQQFIESDYAGVLFTAHPLTGGDHEMLIEVCKGRGENLVSGHVTPDQIQISWKKPVQVISHSKNENVELSELILQQLQEAAQKIQAHAGSPQDIEFVVKNNKLFLVQSRPITKLQFAENQEEWTTADFRDGGVSSDVVSPVMWSLYEKIFSASLPEYFFRIKLINQDKIKATTWYKVFYGRPYWNLKAVKNIMMQVPGFNEKNFDEDLSIPITYEGLGLTTPLSVLGVIKVLPAVFALEKEFKSQLARSQNLQKNFYQIEDFYLNLNFSNLDDATFLTYFKKLIFQDFTFVESEYFQTIYNASNAKMEFLNSLKILQNIDPSIEYIKLISNLGPLEATEPAHELLKLVPDSSLLSSIRMILDQSKNTISQTQIESLPESFKNNLVSFIKRFYYHSERELDLRVPRWGEDFTFILKTLMQVSHSHQPKLSSQTYNAELSRLKKAFFKTRGRWIPGAWKSLKHKLERVRLFLSLREEIRCQSTKMYYFIRLMLLEAAKRKLPDQLQFLIFYNTYENILALLEEQISAAHFIQDSEQNKRYADGFRNFRNPNEIGYRYNFIGLKKVGNYESQNTLKGIGCSAGVIRAKARVCLSISDASELRSGEILVTRFTDPGWTPLFTLTSGVICESGGLLSHAALISREYGIPSVLNVKDATTLIKSGQEIEIDGVKGLVSIL